MSSRVGTGFGDKQTVRILTVDQERRRVECALRDGAAVYAAVWEIPMVFRWPQTGEVWTIRKDSGIWRLDALVQDIDELTNVSLSTLEEGQARISAETLWNTKGERFLTSRDQSRSGVYINIQDYGADPERADNSAQIQAALDAAAVVKGTVFTPHGLFNCLSQVISGVDLLGESPAGSVWQFPTLGSGVAGVVMTKSIDDGEMNYIRGMRFIGPATWDYPSIEAPTMKADCNGLSVDDNIKVVIDSSYIKGFDKGLIYNNNLGHIYVEDSTITDNYYGIYCAKQNNDYKIQNTIVSGNSFANLATASDQGFSSLRGDNVHCGFAPYGIYQEPTPANQPGFASFLVATELEHWQFEAIGNGAILSEADEDADSHSQTHGFSWLGAFSWNSGRKIATRGRDYAIDLPFTNNLVELIADSFPPGFPNSAIGDLNRVRIKSHHGTLLLRWPGALTTDVTIDSGSGIVYAGDAPVLSRSTPRFEGIVVGGGGFEVNATGSGFNGATPVDKRTLGGAATDPATTQTLANNLRQALIDLGLGQT